jgi:hypothetical protein
MPSLLFLSSLQQTVALPAVRQMRSVVTLALPDAPVTSIDDRRAQRSPGAARRARARGVRRAACGATNHRDSRHRATELLRRSDALADRRTRGL